jgi:ribosomal protein L28
MSRKCSNCERGFLSSVSRSHSNIATKRRQNVNLQARRVNGESVLICASCIKAGKKIPKTKVAKVSKAK